MSETTVSYLAGIVDGDGGIYFTAKNKGGVGTLRLAVNSTTLELMRWLVAIAGGSYAERSEWTKAGDKRRLGSKPCYSWQITSERAAIVIRAMLPYLIVKRERAFVALAQWDESYESMKRPKRRDFHTAEARVDMTALGWST